MANIHQSLIEAKNSEDLIYFVEDDYIHNKESLNEMVLTFERISSQIKNDIFLSYRLSIIYILKLNQHKFF